jgi:tetratricopeptide (TPR) repeat protein
LLSKWDAAEAALEKSLQLAPDASESYALLISTYLAANRLPQAAARLEQLLAANPNNAQALMTLALVREKMGDLPKAAEAYEKVISITPDSAGRAQQSRYIYTDHFEPAAEGGRARPQGPAHCSQRRSDR